MEKTFENWLVVSDIDGTLNNKIRKLPKRNYDAIKKFTDLGGNFTLASGRLQSSLERNYNRITPNQPAVVLNGAGLYDYKEKKMLWRSTIGEKGRDFVKLVEKEYSYIPQESKTSFDLFEINSMNQKVDDSSCYVSEMFNSNQILEKSNITSVDGFVNALLGKGKIVDSLNVSISYSVISDECD